MIKKLKNSFEHIAIANHLVRWTLLTIPLSFIVGSLVTPFLWLLDQATELHWQQSWQLHLLPPAGILIYLAYRNFGKNADAENNLIMNEIHTIYNTHFGFSNSEKIQACNLDGDNSRLTRCVELVDRWEKVESFFLKYKDYLTGKVVIYKEVEFRDLEQTLLR